jgi:hypothetical protein
MKKRSTAAYIILAVYIIVLVFMYVYPGKWRYRDIVGSGLQYSYRRDVFTGVVYRMEKDGWKPVVRHSAHSIDRNHNTQP